MTERPIDIIRRVYDGWSQGDFSRGAELFDDGTVFVLQSHFADAGIYVGPEQMQRYMRGLLEPWERLTITPLELTQAGDNVVAKVKQSGAGARSGAITSFTYFQIWTLRGGTLMRLENIIDREKIVEALGADF